MKKYTNVSFLDLFVREIVENLVKIVGIINFKKKT